MQRDALLLAEATDAAARAIEIVGPLQVEDLEADRLRLDALLWNLTILGEAVGQLTTATTSAHEEVPWRKPVELRNRNVHGYWSIDISVLHATATVDLPDFAAHPRRVLTTLDGHA